jgi:hypothetical protein
LIVLSEREAASLSQAAIALHWFAELGRNGWSHEAVEPAFLAVAMRRLDELATQGTVAVADAPLLSRVARTLDGPEPESLKLAKDDLQSLARRLAPPLRRTRLSPLADPANPQRS